MTRTALVTGAAGQDGSYLCEALIAQGYQVHGTVRDHQEADVASSPWLGAVEVHEVDLRDHRAIAALVGEVRPDEVYNLAAMSSVAASWEHPVLAAEINALAVAAMLEACAALDSDVRFVQASSAEIFGSAAVSPQSETTPIRPVNPYGAAKAYAHHLVEIYRGRGLHASACVLFPHESTRRPVSFVSRKITSTVAAIAAGRADELVMGSLTPRRDWGWAPDYVDAMIRAARHDDAMDFVIATGRSHEVRDFVAAAFAAVDITDWEPLVKQDPRFMRPAEAVEQRGDASRARDALGWVPTVGFEEIVSRMVQADLAILNEPAPGS